MTECKKYGFGYLGWSWAGNGNDDKCGSINYLDIVTYATSNVQSNNNWNGRNGFSNWGNLLLNSPGIGIKATSKRASVFN